MKKELNLDYKCNVTLEKNNVLIERKLRDHGKVRVTEYTEEDGLEDQLAKNEDDKKCFGGIILTNVEGNIICKNTLDGRVDLCY